ncbi:hypothetical protein FO519_007924 [Halicephalobus sp. NKZ332]|nr:hypothetical protein FO519_007924 [Halicephalobus sp. NKZ332]
MEIGNIFEKLSKALISDADYSMLRKMAEAEENSLVPVTTQSSEVQPSEKDPLTEKQTVTFDVEEGQGPGEVPKDKLNFVLLVMMLHGIGTLIAWNVFITIAPLYFIETKLKPATAPNNPGYVENFMNFVCLFSQLPNLTVNAIGLFIDKGNLFLRIVISLIIVLFACIFTIIFIFVDTSSWPFGFFVLTMFTVVVLNAANGIYQNSIYGLVGSFPPKYINAVVVGNNICGLLISVICVFTTIFIEDARSNTAAYFGVALLALVLCTGSIFYLRKNEFYSHQIGIEKRASEERGVYGLSDYIKVFKEFWRSLLNVWSNEWAVFVLIALMSYSHGYYSSIAMMYAPYGADASKARIIGKMSAFFLVLGIACGIGCSFLARYPVHLGSRTLL